MARKQHATTVVLELQNELAERPSCHDVESIARLIEDDVLRIVNQRPRKRDLGSLTLGKTLGPAIGKTADFEQRDDVFDCLVDFDGLEAAQPGVVSDVFPGGQVRV
jgi:hypothetical protein